MLTAVPLPLASRVPLMHAFLSVLSLCRRRHAACCPAAKYGIKKKEEKEAEERRRQEELMGGPLGEAGINRAKKTPEELAAEAAAADQDEFTSESSRLTFPRVSRLPSCFSDHLTCLRAYDRMTHCWHAFPLACFPSHSSRRLEQS